MDEYVWAISVSLKSNGEWMLLNNVEEGSIGATRSYISALKVMQEHLEMNGLELEPYTKHEGEKRQLYFAKRAGRQFTVKYYIRPFKIID